MALTSLSALVLSLAWWSHLQKAFPHNRDDKAPHTRQTNPDTVLTPTSNLQHVLRHIAAPDGWAVTATLGRSVARQLGGSGTLATSNGQAESIADVRLSFSCAFAIEPEYAPPQGTVALLRPSRYLSTSTAAEESAAARANNRRRPAVAKGFWTVDATDDDDVPTAIKWRLQCDEGIVVSGVQIVPAGPVYFNALVERGSSEGEVRLVEGRVTVKEDIGVDSPLFSGRGILAEFKVIGCFDCSALSGQRLDPPQT